MAKKKYNLLVVAHPDDETIFFGALLLAKRTHPWKVICVTDANADGMGAKRKQDFAKACAKLKVKDHDWWMFPDIYEKRLDVAALCGRLRALPEPEQVFTHGVLGEYGHPHHQDVCFAVHEVFGKKKPYSSAYNCFPDFTVKLTAKKFAVKAQVLAEIYGSETQRFLNILPATSTEGFTRVDPKEVRALYEFFTLGKEPKRQQLKHYGWQWSFLNTVRDFGKKRMF